jgi:hypothetical protein
MRSTVGILAVHGAEDVKLQCVATHQPARYATATRSAPGLAARAVEG